MSVVALVGEDRLREETPCPIKDAREPLLLVRGKRSCLHRDAYTRHFVSSATRRFDRRFGIGLAVVWNQRLGVGGPDRHQLESRRAVDAATREPEAGVMRPNLRVRCETNVWRVLSAISPTEPPH